MPRQVFSTGISMQTTLLVFHSERRSAHYLPARNGQAISRLAASYPCHISFSRSPTYTLDLKTVYGFFVLTIFHTQARDIETFVVALSGWPAYASIHP
jgi:hypothetical protein